MTNKVIRDGNVAVLYSPGYGAGWSTWIGGETEECLYSTEIVEAIENGLSKDDIVKIAKTVLGEDGYYGGVDDLEIAWIPVGTAFRINEYDGNESIEYYNGDNFNIA